MPARDNCQHALLAAERVSREFGLIEQLVECFPENQIFEVDLHRLVPRLLIEATAEIEQLVARLLLECGERFAQLHLPLQVDFYGTSGGFGGVPPVASTLSIFSVRVSRMSMYSGSAPSAEPIAVIAGR